MLTPENKQQIENKVRQIASRTNPPGAVNIQIDGPDRVTVTESGTRTTHEIYVEDGEVQVRTTNPAKQRSVETEDEPEDEEPILPDEDPPLQPV